MEEATASRYLKKAQKKKKNKEEEEEEEGAKRKERERKGERVILTTSFLLRTLLLLEVRYGTDGAKEDLGRDLYSGGGVLVPPAAVLTVITVPRLVTGVITLFTGVTVTLGTTVFTVTYVLRALFLWVVIVARVAVGVLAIEVVRTTGMGCVVAPRTTSTVGVVATCRRRRVVAVPARVLAVVVVVRVVVASFSVVEVGWGRRPAPVEGVAVVATPTTPSPAASVVVVVVRRVLFLAAFTAVPASTPLVIHRNAVVGWERDRESWARQHKSLERLCVGRSSPTFLVVAADDDESIAWSTPKNITFVQDTRLVHEIIRCVRKRVELERCCFADFGGCD